MLKLIVHADDFGLTEAINRGIVKTHTEGIVTSTSIVACGTAFDDAVRLYRSIPSLDVGVHLTIIEERPVLETVTIPTLVTDGGTFYPHANQFLKRYMINRITIDDVYREFEAQLRKVLDSGIPVSHLDSHQHIHAFPRIFECTVELARAYGIPAVRLPHEKVKRYMLRGVHSVKRLLQLGVLNLFAGINKKNKVVCADHFYGFYCSGDLTGENLRAIINALPPDGTGELVCHPGLEQTDGRYGHWGYNWMKEVEALTDTATRDLIKEKEISLGSYKDLIED
jgi:chitin disaccharide deacetylase